MGKISGTFQVNSWEEKPYNESGSGRKFSRASVKQSYFGELAGQGSIEYTLCYQSDKTSNFIGIELFEGSVNGRPGSFAIQHVGRFENGVAKSSWHIISESGAGELCDLSGKGDFETTGPKEATFNFEFEFV